MLEDVAGKRTLKSGLAPGILLSGRCIVLILIFLVVNQVAVLVKTWWVWL